MSSVPSYRFFPGPDSNKFSIGYYQDKTNASRVCELGDKDGFIATRIDNLFLKALLYCVCALSRCWSLVVIENVRDNIPLDSNSRIYPFRERVTLLVRTALFQEYRKKGEKGVDKLVSYNRCFNSYILFG